ncbi:MAG TPA: hypothetical protein VFG87_13470 [Amycolatopsis sp.]|nr:hypothetical protein [Amycolatopsis sp.]
MSGARLVEWCRLPTSGARAVERVEVDGMALLAIPQLALDRPAGPADMNGGDSDTELLLLRRTAGGYERFQTLSVPGGEDAEFFRIGKHAFLATASIRSGGGPYRYTVDSVLHRWTGAAFEPFQSFPGFAAKQWRHFSIEGRHFLALAQGVALPGTEAVNQPSRIFEWDGERFRPFQDIPGRWGYNWHAFSVAGQEFLAHADHVEPSRLYRWDGTRFVFHQDLLAEHGRAFASFTADGEFFLLAADLLGESKVLRWDGHRFVAHDVLDGPGARELAVIPAESGVYVVRVNFIQGTPAAPVTQLASQLYQWREGRLAVVDEFTTSGGTDVAVLPDPAGTLVAVSNSLSAEVRFATDTVIYRFEEPVEPGQERST